MEPSLARGLTLYITTHRSLQKYHSYHSGISRNGGTEARASWLAQEFTCVLLWVRIRLAWVGDGRIAMMMRMILHDILD